MKRNALYVVALLFATISVAGCTAKSDPQPEAQATLDWRTMPKIDVHTHYTYPRDFLIPVLQDWNMRGVVIEVVNDPSRPRWEHMVEHHQMYPETLLLAASFDASKIEEPDFAENVIAELKEDVEKGAIMVKVWKNIGLVYKDSKGNFIQIDDPRFQPIWDYLAEAGIPVLAHIAEPRAAWQALDETNPHYYYYKDHPQFHFYLHPGEVPTWETVIAARDRWIERNPNLTIVGAHLASLAFDTDEVAKRLDKYPNLSVELAERFGDLAIQPSEKVHDFFVKYQDRILYGTDLGTGRPADELSAEELRAEKEDLIEKRFRVHWDYLTRSDSVQFARTGTPFQVMTRGLGLPAEVIQKVYHENAERILELEPANAQAGV